MSEASSTPNTVPPLPPNEELAAIIAAALGGEGLILDGKVEQVRQKLAAGTLKEEDWSFLIEEALPKTDTEGANE